MYKLFSTLQLKFIELANRIVVSPMRMYSTTISMVYIYPIAAIY